MIVIGLALLVTVDAAEAIGFVVAVFRLAFATPFVPVNAKVPVPPADCLLMTTLVSGMLTASSIPSPVPALLVSAQVMLNDTDVMPVPLIRTEPHAVPAAPTVHSAPDTALLVARLKEFPVMTNWALEPASKDRLGAAPVDVDAPNVHTVVESFEPLDPPRRSMWIIGLSTGLLNVNVNVSLVPNGAGLIYSEGPLLTAVPYGFVQKFVALRDSTMGAVPDGLTPESVTVTPPAVADPPCAAGVHVPVVAAPAGDN